MVKSVPHRWINCAEWHYSLVANGWILALQFGSFGWAFEFGAVSIKFYGLHITRRVS